MRRAPSFIAALVAMLVLAGLIVVPTTTGSFRVAHAYDASTATLANTRVDGTAEHAVSQLSGVGMGLPRHFVPIRDAMNHGDVKVVGGAVRSR